MGLWGMGQPIKCDIVKCNWQVWKLSFPTKCTERMTRTVRPTIDLDIWRARANLNVEPCANWVNSRSSRTFVSMRNLCNSNRHWTGHRDDINLKDDLTSKTKGQSKTIHIALNVYFNKLLLGMFKFTFIFFCRSFRCVGVAATRFGDTNQT